MPTVNRGLPSVALKRGREILLFDCGEGTQRQMLKASLGFNRRMRIFITHLHGDHVLGLPGVMMTMSLLGRTRSLQIYGPRGIAAFLEAVQKTAYLGVTYPVEVYEVEGEGLVCKGDSYTVEACYTNHKGVTHGYALVEEPRPGIFYPEKAEALGVPEGPLWSKLQHDVPVSLPDGRVVEPSQVSGPKRPGRKLIYTGDTRPSENILRLSKDADLLIHDSTLDDSLEETAKVDGHSTPSQAAKIADEAKVKKLILTHISARYVDGTVLVEQARKIFPNTEIAEDLMRVEIPFREDW